MVLVMQFFYSLLDRWPTVLQRLVNRKRNR